MPLAWGNLLPFFCLQLWTSRGSYPSLFPLFLIRYSGCCTFNQHTGLFLQCTIKEPFLCLTPFCSLFWVTCFLSAGCRRKGGNERYSFGLRQKGIVGWDQMVGKMSGLPRPSPKGEFIQLGVCRGLSLLPWWCAERWRVLCWEAGSLVKANVHWLAGLD